MSGKKGKWVLLFTVLFLLLIAIDQYAKGLAVRFLMDKAPVVCIEGVFELKYSENRGAAFGIFQGQQVMFAVIAAIVLLVIVYMLWRMPTDRHYLPMTACLLLMGSGAVGNMIDRLLQGYVVDFLYFSLIDFPIFNVADMYVTVGAFLLAILFAAFYKDEDLRPFALKKKGA